MAKAAVALARNCKRAAAYQLARSTPEVGTQLLLLLLVCFALNWIGLFLSPQKRPLPPPFMHRARSL